MPCPGVFASMGSSRNDASVCDHGLCRRTQGAREVEGVLPAGRAGCNPCAGLAIELPRWSQRFASRLCPSHAERILGRVKDAAPLVPRSVLSCNCCLFVGCPPYIGLYLSCRRVSLRHLCGSSCHHAGPLAGVLLWADIGLPWRGSARTRSRSFRRSTFVVPHYERSRPVVWHPLPLGVLV